MEALTTAGAVILSKAIEELTKKMTSFLAENITKYYSNLTNQELIDSGWAFEDYLKRVYDEYSKSKSVLYRSEARSLSTFFIPVDLQFEKEIPKGRKISLKKPGSYKVSGKDIKEIMHRDKIIITGIGGMGKTMHMKHFCTNAIEQAYKIPVFIPLRWFNDREIGDEAFEELVYKNLQDFGFELNHDAFLYSLKSGKYLFLLDAYDEVSKTIKSKIAVRIQSFARRYSNNSFIISSRQVDDIYSWDEFTVYSLCPLDINQAVHMIWKLDNFDQAIKKRFVDKLYEGMYEQYKSFISVPLLLSILFKTYYEETIIPESMHEFYDRAFETMLYRHDNEKLGFERKLNSNLGIVSFRKVFEQFCYITYIDDKVSFSETELVDFICEAKVVINETVDEESYKKDLVDIACMLIRDGLEYSFIHRNFQEYFAARCVSRWLEEEQKDFCSDFIYSIGIDTVELEDYETLEPVRDKAIDFFNMLYSLNPDRFEHVALKPILEKIHAAFIKSNEDIIDLIHSFFRIFDERIDDENVLYSICFKNLSEDEDYDLFNLEEYNVLCFFFKSSLKNIDDDIKVEINRIVYEKPEKDQILYKQITDDSFVQIRTEYSLIADHYMYSKIVSDLVAFFVIALQKYDTLNKKVAKDKKRRSLKERGKRVN